jgi:ABC-type antimicrobial peptide transport system permease subunit
MSGTDEPVVALSLPGLIERFEQIFQPPAGGAFVVLGMGGTSPLAATKAAGFQVNDVARASTIEEQLASSKNNLAVGMEFAASIAGGLLTALALALGVYFGGRRHEYEFASLEVLGARSRDVFSTLVVEHGLVLVCSLVIGCGVGIGLFALALSFVAPTPSGVPAEMLIAWPAILLASAVAGGTLLLAVALATARIRSRSPLSLLRGEPE